MLNLERNSMSEYTKNNLTEQRIKKTQELGGTNIRPTTSHGYFHGHECHLEPDHLTAYNIKIGSLRRLIFDLTSVHTSDIRALTMFRSYAALYAEKYRHYQNHPFTIHPFSKLRFYIEALIVLVMFTVGLILAVHYSESQTGVKDFHSVSLCVTDGILIVHIIVNFFTGYIAGESSKVAVLDLKQIALRYAKTWLLIDIFSSLSFIPHILDIVGPVTCLVLETAKLLRLPIAIIYLDNVLVVLEASVGQKMIVEIIFATVTYLSWNIYLQFCVEYTIEGSFNPMDPRACSWLTYGNLWNATTSIRFLYSLDRAVGMLRTNTNMNMIEKTRCFEVFFVAAWISSKMLIFHFALKHIMALFGTESARAKYYIMEKQVEHYMVQRKFPPRLKKKILKFYAIRFQSKYFTESRMLSAVSGQLRDDILMHAGRQLVRELDFLKLLPRSLLMQIVFKLRIVIFIAGDIIFKINTVGDCLYFIDKGTVAIYSDSGQEICHLEDGDFFGEIALVRNHFRTASVVAVTNCELFRLDKEDFDSTIAYYPTVYENIKTVAINRFERTCVLDEHHKADLKMAEKMDKFNPKF